MTMSPMACSRIARILFGGVDLFHFLDGMKTVLSVVEKNIKGTEWILLKTNNTPAKLPGGRDGNYLGWIAY